MSWIVAPSVIAVLTIISILVRWYAFNRVDSLAVEISLFSFGYTVFNLLFLSESFQQFKELLKQSDWLLRIIVGAIILFSLSVLHHKYFKELQEKIKKKINEKVRSLNELDATDRLKRESFLAAEPLMRHAVFLTYISFLSKFYVRKGKKDARVNFATLLSAISGQVSGFDEKDFLLDIKKQVVGLVLFFILGLLSLFIAVYPFSFF